MKYSKNITKLANKTYFTVSEVAYLLAVTPPTLRNWDKSGKLKAKRNPINNYRVYRRSDIEHFIRRIESGGRNTRDIL